MLNLQLKSFAGGVEGANIVSWLHSTKTCLCICQVPEPMWVVTASGHLTVPAAVWFINWASQKIEITWVLFRDAAKSRYSETFSPTVVGTPLLAIKQTGSVPEYLAAASEAVTDGNTMLLTLIINGLKPHIRKWVPVGCCTSIDNCYKAIVKANNQASMDFCRSNDASPQPYSAPCSAHNQVGCYQSCQQENGVKRPQEGELQCCDLRRSTESQQEILTLGLDLY
ncbi:hypothetical protein DSO57_1019120 [Entomophthora muscae]|uniref:Uncharacterized protein n=1 Tax=Entomophthora muscae TaxID=34485 RepID=A0ACC2UPV6_9FUNG|nr:hypothetical protein DSO57_1019120 [Entomophthora muscae]